MARRTSGKPEDQEQSAAPQAGTDGADNTQQASAPAAPQDTTQSADDGGGSPPGSSQEEAAPAPKSPSAEPATPAQGGAEPSAGNQDLAPVTPKADLDAPRNDQDSDSEDIEPLLTFVVTDRTDVLHNDKWYREGDPIELNETDAESLFNNGCIKWPKDDAK